MINRIKDFFKASASSFKVNALVNFSEVTFYYDDKEITFTKLNGKLKVLSISKMGSRTTHPIRLKKEVFNKFCKAAGVLLSKK